MPGGLELLTFPAMKNINTETRMNINQLGVILGKSDGSPLSEIAVYEEEAK